MKIIVLLRAKIIKKTKTVNYYVESVRNRFHCNSRFV